MLLVAVLVQRAAALSVRDGCASHGSVSQWLEHAVREAANGSVSFVQVGANDGKMADPLYPIIQRYKHAVEWTGVLVEPVPWLMRRLRQETYADMHAFDFVSAVVNASCANAHVDFFTVDPTSLSPDHWLNGIGSLTVPRVRNEDVYKRISAVPCLTWEALTAEHIATRLGRAPDFVLIDVEGHDHALVRALSAWPFGRPALIVFEMWSADELPEGAERATNEFLRDAGFTTCAFGADRVAYSTRPQTGK